MISEGALSLALPAGLDEEPDTIQAGLPEPSLSARDPSSCQSSFGLV